MSACQAKRQADGTYRCEACDVAFDADDDPDCQGRPADIDAVQRLRRAVLVAVTSSHGARYFLTSEEVIALRGLLHDLGGAP